jgi:hypothetical protein
MESVDHVIKRMLPLGDIFEHVVGRFLELPHENRGFVSLMMPPLLRAISLTVRPKKAVCSSETVVMMLNKGIASQDWCYRCAAHAAFDDGKIGFCSLK